MVFNLFSQKKNLETSEALLKEAFAAGLEAGITMVRIAAARDTEISLDCLADTMQQALDEVLGAGR